MSALAASASDATLCLVAKDQSFSQTNSSPPALQTNPAFRFTAFVDLSAPGSITNATLGLPDGSFQTLGTNSAGTELRIRSDFISQSAMDAAYLSGAYLLTNRTVHDGTVVATLPLSGDTYPPTPQFGSFSALQAVNPASAFTVGWLAFNGGTTNDWVIVSVSNPVGGGDLFNSGLPGEPGALNGTAVSVTIPANTLPPGQTNQIQLRFIKALTNDTISYPGVLVLSGYSKHTKCNLITVAGPPGAPFGKADPGFTRLQFKLTEFPGRVISDGQGRLLWTFVNGGSLEGANGLRIGAIVRTLESGVVDTNFSVGPLFLDAWATAVQPDGKILVSAQRAGDFTANGVPNNHVFRLLPNGTLDSSYNSPVFDNLPRVIALGTDGKLVVGGNSNGGSLSGNGGIVNTVRLNADGSLDTSFTPPVIAGGFFQAIFAPPVIDSAGRILLGGNFTTVSGANYPCLVRLLTNGAVDTSFVQSGYTFLNNSMVRGITVQADGRIVIGGGRFRVTGSGTTNYVLLRLNADGSLDNTFVRVAAATAGFGFPNPRIRMLRQTPDGKFIGVGSTMARFNSDGSLDSSFEQLAYYDNFVQEPAESFWFELLTNGKLIVPTGPLQVGTNQMTGAFRLNADGSLDSNFTSPVFQSEAFPPDARVLADGRLLVWGAFDTVGSTSRRGVARLNPDGTIDSAYHFDAFSDVQSLSVGTPAPDGSLYAVAVRGVDPIFDATNSLVHILAGGQLDTNFQPALQIPQSAWTPPSLFAQQDKLIVWWNDEQDVVDGRASFYRLNSDGSLDSSFVGHTNAFGSVRRDASGTITSVTVESVQMLATFPDGRLLAVRSIDATNFLIVRLDADGAPDTSFIAPVIAGSAPLTAYAAVSDPQNGSVYQVTAISPGILPVIAAQVLANGSILIAGAFRQIGGQNIAGLARLQPNGALDAGFPGGSGAGLSTGADRAARVDSVSLDSQGRIWITGNFDRFNGVTIKGIARLDAAGSVDGAFVPQAGFYDYSLADSRSSGLALEHDGSVIPLGPFRLAADLAGSGPSYTWPYALNKLVAYPPPMLSPLGFFPSSGFRLSADLVEGQAYRLQVSTNLSAWTDLRPLTGAATPVVVDDGGGALLSRRFYRLVSP